MAKTEEALLTRVWRYKLYPTRVQDEVLSTQKETQRHLYNDTTARFREDYEVEGRTIGRMDLQNEFITQGRQKSEYLAGCPYGMSQQTMIRAQRARDAFVREAVRYKQGLRATPPGYPRFRKFGEFTTLAYNAHGQGCKFNGSRVYLQNVGDVKLKYYRPVPEEARILTLSVSQQPDGWFLNVTIALPAPCIAREPEPVVALLTGMEPIVYTSEKEQYPSPMCYRSGEEQLAKAQQRVSRRQKGSNRRRKAIRLLGRKHRHVANQRKEWQRLLAARLTARYGVIVHEDLHPSKHVGRPQPHADPSRPGHFLPNEAAVISAINKAFLDNAWGQFFACLRDAAVWRGTAIVAAPQFEATQACCACGRMPTKPPSVAEGFRRCEHCGIVLPARTNNLVNLLREAQQTR